MAYSDKVVDHYDKPGNVGSFRGRRASGRGSSARPSAGT
jgi:NifU-like protein involved in Fe-S cluster formation